MNEYFPWQFGIHRNIELREFGLQNRIDRQDFPKLFHHWQQRMLKHS